MRPHVKVPTVFDGEAQRPSDASSPTSDGAVDPELAAVEEARATQQDRVVQKVTALFQESDKVAAMRPYSLLEQIIAQIHSAGYVQVETRLPGDAHPYFYQMELRSEFLATPGTTGASSRSPRS